MAYISITENLLITAMSGLELTALRAAALADGQSDPVEDTIARVVNRIRGDVAASGKFLMGPAGTIPDRLLDAALSLIVWGLMQRPAATIIDDQNNSRQKAVDRAERLLERVARGDYGIEDPVNGVESSASRIEVINKTTRHATTDKMNGL